MQIQEIINHIAAGESVAAKESIENVLSAKAFNALQSRKQEMAATLFGGQEQSDEEVTDDEEAYAEEVEHDGEQLNEVFNIKRKDEYGQEWHVQRNPNGDIHHYDAQYRYPHSLSRLAFNAKDEHGRRGQLGTSGQIKAAHDVLKNAKNSKDAANKLNKSGIGYTNWVAHEEKK